MPNGARRMRYGALKPKSSMMIRISEKEWLLGYVCERGGYCVVFERDSACKKCGRLHRLREFVETK